MTNWGEGVGGVTGVGRRGCDDNFERIGVQKVRQKGDRRGFRDGRVEAVQMTRMGQAETESDRVEDEEKEQH